MSPGASAGLQCMPTSPVVHLELRTGNLARAASFYSGLFDWRPESVDTGSGRYLSLDLGGREIEGGLVECETSRPLWLPYVEVRDVAGVTERARRLGASVTLTPREGPVGWRSVIASPDGGEVALWQPKR
jgi:predicted enzyme related to lactoylglutathione lyase